MLICIPLGKLRTHVLPGTEIVSDFDSSWLIIVRVCIIYCDLYREENMNFIFYSIPTIFRMGYRHVVVAVLSFIISDLWCARLTVVGHLYEVSAPRSGRRLHYSHAGWDRVAHIRLRNNENSSGKTDETYRNRIIASASTSKISYSISDLRTAVQP